MTTADPFFALVIYPSTAATQAGHADTVLQMTGAALRSMPGFVTGRLLLSEDGESVITLVEWRDRESFERFRQSQAVRAASHIAAELHPKTYWLRLHAAVDAP